MVSIPIVIRPGKTQVEKEEKVDRKITGEQPKKHMHLFRPWQKHLQSLKKDL